MINSHFGNKRTNNTTASKCVRQYSNIYRPPRAERPKFAVYLPSYGGVCPNEKAQQAMMKRSMYKNSTSVRLLSIEYKIINDMNCVSEYKAMNLNKANEVTRAALPSLMISSIQRISCTFEVNGLAADDSLLLKEIPV